MKKFIMALLALPILFSMMFWTASPVKVKAEETPIVEVVEQKTYTYTCDEGIVEITLIDDVTVKIALTPVGGETLEMVCGYVLEGNKLTVIFNGEQMSLLLNDETMTAIEFVEETVEGWKAEVDNWKETFVTPIIFGLSIIDIVAVILGAINWFVNRKHHKKLVEDNDVSRQNSEKINYQTQVIINRAEDCVEMVASSNEKVKELTLSVQDLTNKTSDLMKLKEVNIVLCNCISAIAQTSPEAVKCGVAEQITKSVNELKNVK